MLRQAKILLAVSVGAIVLAFGMFGVTLRNKITQLTTRSKETLPLPQARAALPMTAASKANPAISTSATNVRPPEPSQPEAVPIDEQAWKRMKGYVGNWDASSMEGSSIRLFNFEMRENPSVPGAFSGYSSVTEMSFAPPAVGRGAPNPYAAIFARMSPHSILWVGEADPKGISFRVEKRVGKQDCPMTSLRMTPFGTNQLIAEWKSEGCPDGELLLTKH